MKNFYFLLIFLLTSIGFHRCEQAPEPVQPTACFQPSKTTVLINENISFNNCSTDALKYGWDFGDGKNSDQESPIHSYTTTGQKTVRLRAYNGSLTHETEEIILVTDNSTVTACFTMSAQTAGVNQDITFTNCSTGATSYNWDFGDGATSTAANPTHQYSAAANYTITLTASNGSNSDQVSKQVTISNDPIACFNPDKVTAGIGENINFSNCSVNADSYSWDFDDGGTSALKDPSYSYSQAGTYTVTLIASAGVKSNQISKQITITEATLPVACFTVLSQNVAVNEPVAFTNCSQNADSYLWKFGDGGTSTEVNPTYSYSIEGTFTVTLQATSGANKDEISLIMNVTSTLASVELNVNMNIYVTYGLFNPGADFVDVAGTFNGWADPAGTTMSDDDGDGIYTVTIPGIEINSTIEYKFRINGNWGNAEFPEWGASGNRLYTVVAGLNMVSHFYNDEDHVVDPTIYSSIPGWYVYYETNFDSEDGWLISDGTTQPAASISGGYYSLTYTGGSVDYYIVQNANANVMLISSANFDVEMYYSVNSDASLLGDGLSWAVNNSTLDDCYYLIDGNGQFIVGDDYHGFWMPDWVSGANGAGTFNKVTIRKFHNQYYVFINEQYVTQYDFFPYPGDYFGIKIGNNSSVQVDWYGIYSMSLSSSKNSPKPTLGNQPQNSLSPIGAIGNRKTNYPIKNDAVKLKTKR